MKNNKKKCNQHQKGAKKKSVNHSTMRCPYCGSPVVLRSADGIYKDNSRGEMLYVCSHYPECDVYVRADPKTKEPMGTLANPQLRALRTATHRQFDKLFKQGYMTRKEAYMWLSHVIDAPQKETHIGKLSEYYCNVVMRESAKFLATKKAVARALN